MNLDRSDRIFQILERPSQVSDFDVLSQKLGVGWLCRRKRFLFCLGLQRVVMYILYMSHLSNTYRDQKEELPPRQKSVRIPIIIPSHWVRNL